MMCRFCGGDVEPVQANQRSQAAQAAGWFSGPVCERCLLMLMRIDSLPIWGLGQLVTEIAHGKRRERLALIAKVVQQLQEQELDEEEPA